MIVFGANEISLLVQVFVKEYRQKHSILHILSKGHQPPDAKRIPLQGFKSQVVEVIAFLCRSECSHLAVRVVRGGGDAKERAVRGSSARPRA